MTKPLTIEVPDDYDLLDCFRHALFHQTFRERYDVSIPPFVPKELEKRILERRGRRLAWLDSTSRKISGHMMALSSPNIGEIAMQRRIGIALPGYKVKDGKVAKKPGRMAVSKRIAQKKSKKVRIKRA